MPDNPEVHRLLQHIESKLDAMSRAMGEMNASTARISQILASHDMQLLGIEQRLERIEKRLGFVGPTVPGE